MADPGLVMAEEAERRSIPALPLDALEGQRGRLFCWTPVCLGAGVALWLALPADPTGLALALLGTGLLLTLAAALAGPWRLRPVALGLALLAAGVLLADLRARAVAAPVLSFRYYGPVEGRIVRVDRSSTDRLRLTLDRVVLERTAPDRTPDRVRISLFDDPEWIDPAPGQTVILTAHLGPPQGPLEPGAFDYRRHAWFEGLGAVGYTRSPVLLLAPADPSAGLAVDRLRDHMSRAVRDRIAGDAGGYAAAVTTGDRAGLGAEANADMRAANLYHLVSISGMHMGMLAAFVFGLVRYGLALAPPVALRLPVKKIAAAVALAAAAFYLMLAGRDVPTERAFVMVAVALVAVLLDRRALSLRAVAIAALAVIILRPESVTNPGFQMSFAATAALVTAFEAVRDPGPLAERWRRIPRLLKPVAALLYSSLVAGTATAPFAALHFNVAASWGLIANLLAVPAMGILVMPGAVVFALTGPLGLDQPGIWMMEAGSRWILWVASWVADLPYAQRHIPAPPGTVLPLVALGGLWLILWAGPGRVLGLAPLALAGALWLAHERPAVLIASDGTMVGVMTPAGRAIPRRSEGLIARGWLENDGDGAGTAAAAARPGFSGPRGLRVARAAGVEVAHVSGRGWQAALADACRPGRLVVLAERAPPDPGPCILYDLTRLERTGAVALRPGPGATLEERIVAGPDRRWTR